MVFYLALLPTLLDLTRITALGYAELVRGDAGGSGGGVWRLYPAGGAGAAALHQPNAIRVLNRGTGAVMAGAAAAIAAR